ncbi:hypothetical protein SAMN05660909_00871 [Chitinophaga terrae (ex Kim and Jung 2007)]|uniref:Uncharacterized protein n=1 Tax=Chitinophaga terrae (ex Kim and Jung 2007) TaxID=408074 RepID=A0A1H3YPP7_9BACT|nr:hypothetical protein [Chitinophaga terrae (ex Kim and Jung 2007)]GEP88414.1 hypothetical protein CTE07_00590 [Chitinophaga terrae (ex Kim and Jung 2007)]SEA13048.1 hypothetical protein SAMN05660909_00871 [Chitinophaga terrae (ex Kim and Jung 2007)]
MLLCFFAALQETTTQSPLLCGLKIRFDPKILAPLRETLLTNEEDSVAEEQFAVFPEASE